MSIHDLRNSVTNPEDLVRKRKSWGFFQYAIKVNDVMVDQAIFKDTSWETLEELADAAVYLEFELDKLESKDFRMEARRVQAMRRVVYRLMSDLFSYRERVKISSPDLLESKVPESSIV